MVHGVERYRHFYSHQTHSLSSKYTEMRLQPGLHGGFAGELTALDETLYIAAY